MVWLQDTTRLARDVASVKLEALKSKERKAVARLVNLQRDQLAAEFLDKMFRKEVENKAMDVALRVRALAPLAACLLLAGALSPLTSHKVYVLIANTL